MMCDSKSYSPYLSPLEKHINDKKHAIDLLKISDNTYVGFREEELFDLKRFLSKKIRSETGGALFVFGLSGTGKTTTVEHALSQCAKDFKKVKTVSLSGCSYVSLKAFKNDFYHRVLGFTPEKASTMLNISSNGRLQNYTKFTNLLIQHFKTPPSIRVCLIDEIDYLSTFLSTFKGYDKSNWLQQALFRAACSPNSKVIIVGISNNLEFATKIKTEKCERLLFKPYNENQMVNIVMEKLKSLNDENCQVLNKTSLLVLARRVANTSGDCRTYLDSFIRALSNSLCNLERDSQSLASLETNSGPDSLATSEVTFSNKTSSQCSMSQLDSEFDKEHDWKQETDFKTPTRNLREIDLSKYNVGNKEIGIVTPTLSLNKREQLKHKLSDLPILQLLLLLAICKSSLVLERIISPNDAKKYFLELAEKLKLDSREVENFCNSEFDDSLDNFRQLSLISKTEMLFNTDPETVARIVIDSSVVFDDLDFEMDISDPSLMLTRKYSNLTKTFGLAANSKKKKGKVWWSR